MLRLYKRYLKWLDTVVAPWAARHPAAAFLTGTALLLAFSYVLTAAFGAAIHRR